MENTNCRHFWANFFGGRIRQKANNMNTQRIERTVNSDSKILHGILQQNMFSNTKEMHPALENFVSASIVNRLQCIIRGRQSTTSIQAWMLRDSQSNMRKKGRHSTNFTFQQNLGTWLIHLFKNQRKMQAETKKISAMQLQLFRWPNNLQVLQAHRQQPLSLNQIFFCK